MYEILDEISDLSTEYYYLLPRANLQYEKLPILGNPIVLNREIERVKYMLELELTENLILAAQYRKDEVNPVDYIYW